VAIVDAGGAIRARREIPTRARDGEELYSSLAALIDAVRADVERADGGRAGVGRAGVRQADGGRPGARLAVCGVGCGGPMAPDGTAVSPLNIAVWRDFPLRERLRAHLGLPVFIDNDAKALALGEAWRGAARGVRDFIALVVSTGVGGGIVVDGHLLDGALGNAGHIGHVIVVPGGRACRCGAAGCLEAEASGPSIEAITGGRAADAPLGLRRRTGRLVGEALGSVVALLDLRLAVVAGSVALGYGEPFFTAAQDALARTARLAYTAGAQVVPAGLGADGPLVGAAAVGWRGMGVDVGVGLDRRRGAGRTGAGAAPAVAAQPARQGR
jgi:glucokinase